jgi:hypothetical protein
MLSTNVKVTIPSKKSKNDTYTRGEQMESLDNHEQRLEDVLKKANDPTNLQWDEDAKRRFQLLFPDADKFGLPISASWVSIDPIPFTDNFDDLHLFITDDRIIDKTNSNDFKVRNYSPDTYMTYLTSKWDKLTTDEKSEIKNKLVSSSNARLYIKQINFLLTLNKILFKQKGGMSYYSNDEDSTDDEGVMNFIIEYEPTIADNTTNAGIKDIADQKVVCPYLLGAFVNGELDIGQVAKLKDRKSRRKLFKKITK